MQFDIVVQNGASQRVQVTKKLENTLVFCQKTKNTVCK